MAPPDQAPPFRLDRRAIPAVDRRAFFGVALAILGVPGAVSSQPGARLPRLGSLTTGVKGPFALAAPLAALGYIDGQTIILETRFAEGRVDRLPALAAELVQLNSDVIVAWGVEPVEAVRKATARIPIVMVGSSDPVGMGLAASLARPGGNVTGVSFGGPELAGKRLELVREVLPGLSRVALMRDPSTLAAAVQATESAARALNLRLDVVAVKTPGDFDRAFTAAVKARDGAMLLNESSMLTAHRAKLAGLSIKHRLPVIGSLKVSTQAGFLMSYGVDLSHVIQRVASLVDKILKGAKPDDLPFEQPTKFELAINKKTAKALGITVPTSLLERAEVTE
jgi:ABC-type uncharacterized transport system substrate-binding protein